MEVKSVDLQKHYKMFEDVFNNSIRYVAGNKAKIEECGNMFKNTVVLF
ncbi:hypothetical protein [Anaerofustis sp.]|nr:hypothetical protein [Anaerofustis sp.]